MESTSVLATERRKPEGEDGRGRSAKTTSSLGGGRSLAGDLGATAGVITGVGAGLGGGRRTGSGPTSIVPTTLVKICHQSVNPVTEKSVRCVPPKTNLTSTLPSS